MIQLIMIAAGLALWVAAPLAAAPSATVDPPRDRANPAANIQLLVPSHGVGMNALFFRASGAGPKPTMLLLHGLPGNERNLDLAQAVRRAGWNVLTFTYRGAWGSPGRFSIENAVADAGAALAYLRTPDAAARFGVDRRRLVIAGHSMGGLAAALTAAQDRELAGTVLLDAWDIGATADWMNADRARHRAMFIAETNDLGHALVGATAESLADEVLARGPGWHLTHRAAALARAPLLTIYASDGIAADNRALAAAVDRQPGARLKAIEIASDHSFADSRIKLAQAVVDWLAALPR
ncbi:MAG: alpha/beta fold hydrolase [Sphingomonadaceae bacterium]|nr:alpha/beta fold hydrolase [Sphingomonadaceae bacterium]